jgi:hypothetical protein
MLSLGNANAKQQQNANGHSSEYRRICCTSQLPAVVSKLQASTSIITIITITTTTTDQ